MATRMDDFNIEIRQDDFIRFISVYICKKGNETKRHILNMNFRVIENATPLIGWKDVLNFYAINVIDKYFLPLQSVNVSWQSLRIVKSGIPQRHPLTLRGKINQDIGTLEKGLKIEFQRIYAKQASFTYLYGIPANYQELENMKALFNQLEELYLDPIGDDNTMTLQYQGGNVRNYGNRVISCIVRGDLGKRKKYKSKKQKKLTRYRNVI